MKRLVCVVFLFTGLIAFSQGDINKMVDGKKQGPWKIYGNDKDYKGKGYKPEALVEEGEFIDGKKTGLWKTYWPNGKIKSEVEHKLGRPSGPYKQYYENGQVQEEGTWKNNSQRGTLKRWHPNGQLSQEKTFNDAGIIDGKVIMYHENGKIDLEYTMKNGVEDGEMKSYYPNGDLKETVMFKGGKADEATRKSKPMVNPPVDLEKFRTPSNKTPDVVKDGKQNDGTAPPKDGYAKVYDANKNLVQDGEFKNGKLYNGKWYKYD
ncbi:MAG TPA: toxin-antitoxin system YwqK family antitoxin, partial [Flavobacteriales bacterium]|nr:toxin-antitoxin system YwqK family antitoxin [Flavobacteriales bacterium]